MKLEYRVLKLPHTLSTPDAAQEKNGVPALKNELFEVLEMPA